jgi:prepilin signal peptidase PulO-like enzyme (type II secretory pathway)
MMTLLLDMAPTAGAFGLMAGAVFFVLLAAAAFIAFKMMKRTVKMAFRIAVVGIILAIAVAGSIGFWALGSGSSKPRSAPARNR